MTEKNKGGRPKTPRTKDGRRKPENYGRPTVMTPETVNKLEQAFSIGATDAEACTYADISRQTLYNYQNENKDFLDRKEALKEKPILQARKVIVDALGKDDKAVAQWYLERKVKSEFSPRVENTGKDGADIIPKKIEIEFVNAPPNSKRV